MSQASAQADRRHRVQIQLRLPVFINQLREKVGVVYGNPEATPGGRALKFYSSVRLEVRRVEQLKSGGRSEWATARGSRL